MPLAGFCSVTSIKMFQWFKQCLPFLCIIHQFSPIHTNHENAFAWILRNENKYINPYFVRKFKSRQKTTFVLTFDTFDVTLPHNFLSVANRIFKFVSV